jgi:hypothetical protein
MAIHPVTGRYTKARHSTNKPSKAVRRRNAGMQRRLETTPTRNGFHKPGSQNPRKYSR